MLKPQSRWLKLMDMLSWQGIDRWWDMQSAVQAKEIIPFKTWVREHLYFIEEDRVLTAIEDYYFKQAPSKNSMYVAWGKHMLLVMYRVEQAHGLIK